MSAVLSPDGKFLLVLNGGYNPPSHQRARYQATATRSAATPVPDGWLGLALSPNGRRSMVGGGSSAAIYEFCFRRERQLTPGSDLRAGEAADANPRDFIGDVAVSPDGHLLYACDLYHDSIVVVNPQSGVVIDRFKTGRRPYRILFHPDGKSFFVTSWADGTHGPPPNQQRITAADVAPGPHPTDMVWRDAARVGRRWQASRS